MSFWWTDPFIMVKYYLPPLAIFLILKSLCNINTVIPVFICLLFSWYIFFHFIISTNQYFLFEWHLCSRYYIVVCSTYLLLCSKLLQILDAYIITILFLKIVWAGLGCAVLLFCVGYSPFKVRRGGREEIPSSKVRSSGCALLEQLWRDILRPR